MAEPVEHDPVFPWNDLMSMTYDGNGRGAALVGLALFEVLEQIRDEIRALRREIAATPSGTVPGEE